MRIGAYEANITPGPSGLVETALSKAVPVVLSGVVYWRLLWNYFVDDDFAHMYNVANNGLWQFLLTPHAGHLLVVRNLIFYGFYELFGLAPGYYFASVLVTHLVNVYLLAELIQRLTGSSRLACFGATLWGTSPVNEGSLGWYSVYGHVLVATMYLWVLNDLLRSVGAPHRPSWRRIGTWYLLLLVGVGCFGVGIAVAMTFGGVVLLLLPKGEEHSRIARVFSSQAVVVPLLFFGLHRLYTTVYRGFDPSLLSPLREPGIRRVAAGLFARLLLYAPSSLLLPYPCVGAGESHLACDAVSILCLVALTAGLVRAPAAARRQLAAFALSAVAVYALIAVGRAPMLSMLGNAVEWGATQWRYHYVGPIAVTAVVCLLLNELGRFAVFRASGWILLLAWLGVTVALLVALRQPLDHHDAARRETKLVLGQIDAAVSAVPENGAVYIDNGRFGSVGPFPFNAPDRFPGWAAVFMIAYPSNVVRGRRVYFVETDWRVLAAVRAEPTKRIVALLVAPGERPGGAS